MAGERMLRINEAVREVLGTELRELADPRIGFTTITSVRVAKDLKHAQVFFTVLGDEAQRAATQDALTASRGVLQRAVAREVKLRETPQLRFEYDELAERALRIDALLAGEAPAEPGVGPDPS